MSHHHRPVTSLGHREGGETFSGTKVFKLCSLIFKYVQHIFPEGLTSPSTIGESCWLHLQGSCQEAEVICDIALCVKLELSDITDIREVCWDLLELLPRDPFRRNVGMKTNGIMHTPTNITFLYILFFNLRCRCWAQKRYNSECVIAYISGQYYPVLNYSENLHTSRCVVYNIESRNRCLKRTWFHSPDRERNFRLHVPVSLMYKTIRKCQGSKVSVTATLRGHFNVTTELAHTTYVQIVTHQLTM